MAGNRTKFAQNLKAIREARGMTQETLAEKLDINVRYIQQLEGRLTPNVKLDTISNLARVLKVPAADFLKGI